MNKTTIHCETTAPMFMAGAEIRLNQRGKEELIPELRAASVKGAMRFIWRAVQCAGDVDKLRKTEGELFGNAFGGTATKQSDMRLRVENAQLSTGSELMTPHRNLPDYDGRNRAFPAQALKTGGTFDLVISSFCDEKTHTDFVRLFGLTCLLYGFGRRSRKGFGTVIISGIEGAGDDIDLTFGGVSGALNSLSMFGAEYKQSGNLIERVPAGKPENYPFIESIRIAGTRSHVKPADIIDQIGMAVHHYAGDAYLGTLRPRFASSVLLSTVPWSGGGYRCVVTQLHCAKPISQERRKEFYKELDGRL